MSSSAITVRHLFKRYPSIQALCDVSFEVPADSVFCILGPNGAGKSTLIKILTATAQADKGTATVDGFDVSAQPLQVRKRIGMVAQDNHFDQYLSVWHNLTLHAELHGMSRKDYEPRITRLLEKTNLYSRRLDSPEQLSGGMKRRISLIRALIHEPKVLFLDEPTTGLDPAARIELWHTIEALKRTTTVILTTHYMEEAERLSDQILLLNQGQVLRVDTAQALKNHLQQHNRFQLVLSSPQATTVAQQLENRPDVQQVQETNAYRLTFDSSNPAILQELVQNLPAEWLSQVGRLEPGLEEVFLSIDAFQTETGPCK